MFKGDMGEVDPLYSCSAAREDKVFGFSVKETSMTAENRDWQDLCEAASKETDSERLITLVSKLIEALDEQKTPANGAQAEVRSRVVETP